MLVSKLILGITGNIASGKSLIAGAFARKGAALIDADQLAREVVSLGSPVLKQLEANYGKRILNENGTLNREMLGQLIFADPVARERLNHIIHPEIADLATKRLQELKRKPEIPLVVYEAPLLFEAGAEGRVDRVLVIRIDPEVQLKRLMSRDKLDEKAARQRIDAQMSQEEKLARADFIIDNSGSVEEALHQVDKLWEELVTE